MTDPTLQGIRERHAARHGLGPEVRRDVDWLIAEVERLKQRAECVRGYEIGGRVYAPEDVTVILDGEVPDGD